MTILRIRRLGLNFLLTPPTLSFWKCLLFNYKQYKVKTLQKPIMNIRVNSPLILSSRDNHDHMFGIIFSTAYFLYIN
jgi:hypothetical protein